MTACADWIVPNDLTDCNCPDAPETVINDAITVASDILYALSGRQFPGLCTETVRPCLCGSCGPSEWLWETTGTFPLLVDGTWHNVCGHSGYCGCFGRAIRLPRERIESVDQILIDGAIFADFRLDKPGWVIRTDGNLWPTTQDIWKDTSQSGTWSVGYTYGRNPPEGGMFAAKYLTAEIVKACVGDKCRLPAHAVAVTRRGITYELEAMKGRVGIPEADMWLNAVNPNGRTRRAKVTSPDDPRFVPVDSGS